MAYQITIPSEVNDFIFQLILLIIGTIITIKLIPYFTNKYQDRQLEIDRRREDRRQQLQIQHEIIDKSTRIITQSLLFLETPNIIFQGEKIRPKWEEMQEIIAEGMAMLTLLDLYYGKESEVYKEFDKISSVLGASIEYVTMLGNNDFENKKKIIISQILARMNDKRKADDVLKNIESDGISTFITKSNFNATIFFDLLKKNVPKIN